MHEHRVGLPAAEAAVRADQLLERGDLVGFRVDGTDHDEVADVCRLLVTQQVVAGLHAVRQKGVLPGDQAVA